MSMMLTGVIHTMHIVTERKGTVTRESRSSSKKLLVADFWTYLLWTILFMRLMCENKSFPISKICSALVVKSCLSFQRALSQLEIGDYGVDSVGLKL